MLNTTLIRKARARARHRLRSRTEECAQHVSAPSVAPAVAFDDHAAVVFENPGLQTFDDEPPFDPPDDNDILGMGDVPIDEPPFDVAAHPDVFANAAADSDEPPFDPPDEEGDVFVARRVEDRDLAPLELAPDAIIEPVAPPTATTFGPAHPMARRGEPPPVPPISVHVSWDRSEFAAHAAALAADRRMARAEVTSARGGLDAAIARFASHPSPDLLVLDTTLRVDDLRDGLNRLADVLERTTKVIIIGTVNDVTLLRDLAARGISEYILAPAGHEHIVHTACTLFAGIDKSRVIAVTGARGGVGASTIAQNLAWCIAERQAAATTLLDLDLAFGASTFNFNHAPPHSIADVMIAPESFDAAFLDRAIIRHTPRLHLLTAPATLERSAEFDADTVRSLISRVRRTSSYVVLDLPHAWSGAMKQTLAAADDVVIVASPDLASLRNAKNIYDQLLAARPAAEPMIVLSMTGAPKRPEILLKDFTEALGATPLVSFAFDPGLFGMAAIKAQMIGEAEPQSKAALAFEALAEALTGRKPIASKAPPKRKRVPAGARLVSSGRAPKVAQTPSKPTSALEAPRAAFTFIAPSVQQLDLPFDPKSEPAPLELVTKAPAPELYIASAREAAAASIGADVQLKPARRRSSGLIRAVALMILIVAGGLWLSHAKSESAAAAEPTPPVTSPTQRFQALTPRLQSGDPRSVADLRALAETGYAPAQYRLAQTYEQAGDLAQARAWTARAAAGGHVRAMHDLGVYYARGDGGALDPAAAFRWFRQAAAFGVADSAFNLGILYEQGRGVSADASEATFWFLVAMRAGDANASAHAETLEAQLTPMQREQAQARADAFRAQTPDASANAP